MKKVALSLTLSLSLFAQTITLKEGWNLLGAIEDLNIESNGCIEKVFSYNDNSWNNLREIKKGRGFWAYAKSECSLNVTATYRGKLISSELLSTVTKQEVDFVISLGGYNLPSASDIEIYKVSYSTIDTKEKSTTLTGIVAIPKGSLKAPILSYQHGTIHTKTDAPSMLSDNTKILASLSSTNGFITVMSDYLGYNTIDEAENSLHPYHLKTPTLSATLDLLRATKEFLAKKEIEFNNQLFLMGYSEGGYATMALDNELSTNDEFNVTASTPMAGAYDLNYTSNYFINLDTPHPNPIYFPFVVLAYNNYYGFSDTPKDFFNEEYKSVVDVFDNLESYSWDEINSMLNPIIKEMFDLEANDGSYKEFEDELNKVYVENSVYDYTPEGKVRLYHCKGDEDVPYKNTTIAYESLKDRGEVELVEIENFENLNHNNCVVPSLSSAFNWFIEIKE